MSITVTPWLLAAATAVWFGLMARTAQRSWVIWAVGGALFALITSTFILGLGQAVSIPLSDHDRKIEQVESVLAAFGVIVVVGWLFTLSLHQQHLKLWRKFRPPEGMEPAGAPTESSTPPPLPQKKAPKRP